MIYPLRWALPLRAPATSGCCVLIGVHLGARIYVPTNDDKARVAIYRLPAHRKAGERATNAAAASKSERGFQRPTAEKATQSPEPHRSRHTNSNPNTTSPPNPPSPSHLPRITPRPPVYDKKKKQQRYWSCFLFASPRRWEPETRSLAPAAASLPAGSPMPPPPTPRAERGRRSSPSPAGRRRRRRRFDRDRRRSPRTAAKERAAASRTRASRARTPRRRCPRSHRRPLI